MPLDVLGRTRATLMHSTSVPWPRGLGNLFNLHRDRDRLLQLLILNEEFLVNAGHQPGKCLTTSIGTGNAQDSTDADTLDVVCAERMGGTTSNTDRVRVAGYGNMASACVVCLVRGGSRYYFGFDFFVRTHVSQKSRIPFPFLPCLHFQSWYLSQQQHWLRPCPLYTPPVAPTDWMVRWSLGIVTSCLNWWLVARTCLNLII